MSISSKTRRFIITLLITAVLFSPALGASTSQAAAPSLINVKLFFVAEGDAGASGKKIGCDDSIIAVNTQIPRSRTPLRDVLTLLFSIKEETIPSADPAGLTLTNSIHASTLKVDGFSLHDGILKVSLSGEMSLAGECDDPRLQAQIEETALQFSTINSLPVTGVNVFINRKPLESFFGKGEG